MLEGRRLGWTLAAVGMLLVSTDSFFIRLADTDPWNIALLVAVCSLPVQLLLNARFGPTGSRQAVRSTTRPLLAVAILATISQISFISAITRTDVANVVVIVAAAPIMAAVVARIALGERASRRVWQAIGITVIGISIVVAGSLGEPNLDGDLLALLAIAAFAVNMNVWRRYPELNRYTGLALSALLMLVVSSFFASPFGLDSRTYLAAAAMGLVFNPAGRIAHSTAPRYAPTAEVALFTPVETVAASLWAWLAFSETPELATVIGGLVVVAGVAFGTIGSRARTTAVGRT